MANETMVLLEKIVVPSGGADEVTFTNIPQSYTDLQIVATARCTTSASTAFGIRFNGSSTAVYSMRRLWGNGASASSGNSSSVDNMEGILGMSDANMTANTFGSTVIYIPNYTSSNNKSVSVDAVNETNGTTAYAEIYAGLWANTAAITSISLGYFTDNFAQYSTFYLYGVAKQGVTPTNAPAATGGDSIVFDGTYWIHTFRSSGTFTPKKNLTCDYLVVAGGGGGGTNIGGGGGAGGMRCTVTGTGGSGSLESPLSLAANTAYTVTIGAGGAAGYYAAGTPNNGGDGSNSVFSTITSTGGGGGDGNNNNGRPGGSGGGGDRQSTGGAASPSGQGFAGGNGASGELTSGGGGGASAVGANATASGGGNGGNGRATSISGISVTYAGGGGGCAYNSGDTKGTGGTGGGGDGTNTSRSSGSNGSVNLGGGGGGWSCVDAGGSVGLTGFTGGSGIVIVRYAA